MANHQKFIKYLLSFVIAFSPVLLINNANAASLGGWSMSNPVAKGASTLYEGAKTALINGKNVAKTSTALVTPVVKDVSKVLARGVAGVALAFAVEQILGSVDWVLDPANNQIVYKSSSGDCSSLTSCPYPKVYYINYQGITTGYHSSMSGACSAFVSLMNAGKPSGTYFDLDVNGTSCYGYEYRKNVIYQLASYSIASQTISNPSEEKEKTLPLDVVSAQVISNAEADDKSAQVATTTASADIVKDAEKDDAKAKPIVNQLEANSKTETDESGSAESKPRDPAKPEVGSDLSIEFPVFCGWAPTICEAATTVIKLPTTISEYWDYIKTKTSEWESALEDFFKEKTSDKTELEIPTPVAPDIDTNINFSSACPANFTLANFSYHGTSQNWQVDFSKFCDVFGTYVKPVVIAMGAFTAALIIGGVRTNE